MSRHKLVKNLDLDNEMDDYDGGDDYGYDGAGTGGEGMFRSLFREGNARSLLTYCYSRALRRRSRSCPSPHLPPITDNDFRALLTPNRADATRYHRSQGSVTTECEPHNG